MSTLGRVQYSGGGGGDIMHIQGDTMMSVERYHAYTRGYHDECGEIS